MSILNNAISSIQVGIEDYKSDDPRRINSAIRNVYAGILLLFKEKLCILSPSDNPEVLIYEKVKPIINQDGTIKHVPDGKKTIDSAQILKRFRDYNIAIDSNKFKKIQDIRNDIEHRFTEKPHDILREALSESFLIIKKFLSKELNHNPRDILGDDCWNDLLEIQKVYSLERAECLDSLKKLNWRHSALKDHLENISCPNCSSNLIKSDDQHNNYPDFILSCSACGVMFSFHDVLLDFIGEIYFAESYLAATQGGEDPIEECEDCGESTYHIFKNICFNCGYSRKYYSCIECGKEIGLMDDYIGINICDACEALYDMLYRD